MEKIRSGNDPSARNPRSAPVLAALLEAQQEEGKLTRVVLERLAGIHGVPLAQLQGLAEFYHFLHLGQGTPPQTAVCRGPICSLSRARRRGDGDLGTIACPGLCDQPVAEYRDGSFLTAAGSGGGFTPAREVPNEEVLLRYGRAEESEQLETYRALGGYRQLSVLLVDGETERALDELEASGLCGRGGAAFPLARKLRAVRSQPGPEKYVICNADEGEPGTFKDRILLHLEPHLIIEGMAICGYLVGASTGIIYLRYEYPEARDVLERAIGEARAAGLLGANPAGSGFDVQLVRGAGSYVCGEETALLSSLEGRMPWPRERPPFPTEKGLYGKPTAINNVETLANVVPLLEMGAAWYRSLGRGDNAGTKIYSVSGTVQRPGNYELPLGVTARELIIDCAGGPPDGRRVKAFTLGGISGGLLGAERLDLPLDFRAPQAHGVFLGSGGIVVLDDRCCVVDFVHSCLSFYESESCGRCFPCRIGTIRLREMMDALIGAHDTPTNPLEQQLAEVGSIMKATSACGLGRSAPLLVEGLVRYFAAEFRQHADSGTCPAGVCRR